VASEIEGSKGRGSIHPTAKPFISNIASGLEIFFACFMK
jgi:hypothetical protein